MKEKKYIIELTERQLKLIADCVEDCHRFMSGQMEMSNMTACLDNNLLLGSELKQLQLLVTPRLTIGASYSWNGGSCPNEYQRKFIAETYPIYREILHFFAVEDNLCNAYSSETLTCKEGGKPIKISRKE